LSDFSSAKLIDIHNQQRLTSNQMLWILKTLQSKHAKWDIRSVEQSVLEAKVDLNPHQVEAAIFAFRNPMSGGVILADEVGLGKTIEAGLILSQLWSENKKRILIIAPKSLRHQWQDELLNLFQITSSIIDTSDLKKREPGFNPLAREGQVVITNEHLIARCPHFVELISWDCVVIDEAHKLANVWRSGAKEAKRAKAIRKALAPHRKILLTATPMQNSLMELFGLVSFVDERLLGTADSFKATFNSATFDSDPNRMAELRQRISQALHRNLRSNVSEYINYKRRTTITARFEPSEYEDKFRIDFEAFLRRGGVSLAAADSALLKLLYLKLLASSPNALKNTILGLTRRLLMVMVLRVDENLFNQTWAHLISIRDAGMISKAELENLQGDIFGDSPSLTFATAQKVLQENPPAWINRIETERLGECTEDEGGEDATVGSIPESIGFDGSALAREAKLVFGFLETVSKIGHTSKSSKLIDMVRLQFDKAAREGWPEKAVIFTEFRTTQDFVLSQLKEAGFSPDKDVVIFNGDSGSADERRQKVEQFRNSAKIFLTTEAGAEGLNLQFCNLVINFDLPWNPQRIEQRIGRCHRYGQRLDVIVVNFVNSKNPAEERILDLLQSKFEIFESAFGVSDQVIGAIASGANFEKDMAEIYLSARSPAEIERSFNEVLRRNKTQIDDRMAKAWESLNVQFNDDVRKKLKNTNDQVLREISTNQARLKGVVMQWLEANNIQFSEGNGLLKIKNTQGADDLTGNYTFEKSCQKSYELLHPKHQLVLRIESELQVLPQIKIFAAGFGIDGQTLKRGDTGKIWLKQIKSIGVDEQSEYCAYGVISAGVNRILLNSNLCDKLLNFGGAPLSVIQSLPFEEPIDFLNQRISTIKAEHGARSQSIFFEEEAKYEAYRSDLERGARVERDQIQQQINNFRAKFLNLPLDQQMVLQSDLQKLKDKQLEVDEKLISAVREARIQEKAHSLKVSKGMKMEVIADPIAEFTFEIT
jgi:superfamily II DNA or RNA helicase